MTTRASNEIRYAPRVLGSRSVRTAPTTRPAAEGRPDVLGAEGLLRLQRAVGNAGTRSLASGGVLEVLSRSTGAPLDEPARLDMEARLGAVFSDVRVRTDEDADRSARCVKLTPTRPGPTSSSSRAATTRTPPPDARCLCTS